MRQYFTAILRSMNHDPFEKSLLDPGRCAHPSRLAEPLTMAAGKNPVKNMGARSLSFFPCGGHRDKGGVAGILQFVAQALQAWIEIAPSG